MVDHWGADFEGGAMGIYHHAFPDSTWRKEPKIQMGHWWVKWLSDQQVSYAFSDVVTQKKVLASTEAEASYSVSHFCVIFPNKPLASRPPGHDIRLGDFESGATLTSSKPDFPRVVFSGLSNPCSSLSCGP